MYCNINSLQSIWQMSCYSVTNVVFDDTYLGSSKLTVIVAFPSPNSFLATTLYSPASVLVTFYRVKNIYNIYTIITMEIYLVSPIDKIHVKTRKYRNNMYNETMIQ